MKQAQTFLRKFALLAGIAATSALPLNAHAVEIEMASTITRVYSYSVGAHVIVQVANPPSQCTAFWFKPDDDGFKNSYSLVLSAYHTQVFVRFVAETTDLWSGSNQPHCRVTAVALD
jgi:hypothetical protein